MDLGCYAGMHFMSSRITQFPWMQFVWIRNFNSEFAVMIDHLDAWLQSMTIVIISGSSIIERSLEQKKI